MAHGPVIVESDSMDAWEQPFDHSINHGGSSCEPEHEDPQKKFGVQSPKFSLGDQHDRPDVIPALVKLDLGDDGRLFELVLPVWLWRAC